MFSRKLLIYSALIILMILCGYGIFVIYKSYSFYKDSQNAAFRSCIVSIRTILIRTILDNKDLRVTINPKTEWRALNKNEIDYLFNTITNPKGMDCENYPYLKEGKTQNSEYLYIAVRQIDSNIDIIVETK